MIFINNDNIIISAIDGDINARSNIYLTYYDKVYNVCLKIVREKHEAEDLTQETFIKAIKNIDKLKDPQKFEKWLLKIASNLSKSYLRKKKPVLINEENPTIFFEEIFDDENNNPENLIIENESKQYILSILDDLPSEQKQAVYLYYFEDKSVAEISHKTNCSEHCVRGRLKLGRKKILNVIENLKKEDKKAYFNALFGASNLIKPLPTSYISKIVYSILTKALTVVFSLALACLMVYGSLNLISREENPQNTSKDENEIEIGVNETGYNTKTIIPLEDRNYDLVFDIKLPEKFTRDENIVNDFNEAADETLLNQYYSYSEELTSYAYCFVDVINAYFYTEIKDNAQGLHECLIYDKDIHKNVEYKVYSDSIAYATKKTSDGVCYYAVVRCDNSEDVFNSNYCAFIKVDTMNGYVSENEFFNIIDSVKFSYIAHENVTWFDKFFVNRFAFDADEEDYYLSTKNSTPVYLPIEQSFSVNNKKVEALVSMITSAKAEKSLETLKLELDSIRIGLYDDNNRLIGLIDIYENGDLKINDITTSEISYFELVDGETLYNEAKRVYESEEKR